MLLRAFDAGVNFVDTAEAYDTEDIVGAAVAQRDRAGIVISTKKRLRQENISPEQLRAGLNESLRRLRSDYVDIYHLHGLRREQYEYYLQEIVPTLQDLRREEKIRYIGVTESWSSDLQHRMLQRALEDDVWDVIMVGFNLLNQTARQSVLPAAIEKNIGVLIMFAVRRALSRPDKLAATLQALIDSGELEPEAIDLKNPLGFLLEDGAAASIPDAAYRFCRAEAGAQVILSGTGNPLHLDENLASFRAGAAAAGTPGSAAADLPQLRIGHRLVARAGRSWGASNKKRGKPDGLPLLGSENWAL